MRARKIILGMLGAWCSSPQTLLITTPCVYTASLQLDGSLSRMQIAMQALLCSCIGNKTTNSMQQFAPCNNHRPMWAAPFIQGNEDTLGTANDTLVQCLLRHTHHTHTLWTTTKRQPLPALRPRSTLALQGAAPPAITPAASHHQLQLLSCRECTWWRMRRRC